jgi:hypothetical protein
LINDKKSFDELVQEIETEREIIREKIAKEYVPRLCNALRRDRPDLKSTEIRLTVITRLCHKRRREILSEEIVRKHWPDWLLKEGRRTRNPV